MSFLKRAIWKIVSMAEGRLAAQRFFERLYELSLSGMNYGHGDEIEQSGELGVIRYVLSKAGAQDRPLMVFDVGANVGKYTSALLAAADNDALTVCAFEPSAATYGQLVERVQGFKNVRTFNLALGDVNAKQTLYTDADLSGLASIYKRNLEYRNIKMERTEIVQVCKIDDFCSEQKIDAIHFLKLDVEGHELAALKGAKHMLSHGRIRFIQFEFGGCNIDSRTYFRDFFELLNGAYTIFRIVKHGLCPITRYKESYEVFVTINYLAELR